MSSPTENEAIARVRADVVAALRDPAGAGEPLARACRACVALLPVDGASVSVMSGAEQRETLYASDDTVAAVESLQFTLGEGPCFEAFTQRRPVLVADLEADAGSAWPVFATEIAAHPVGAIFAFPLQSGAVALGAMDLYRHEPGWLTPDDLATALQVVDIATLALLGLQHGASEGEWLADLPRNREVVHQATGMLIAEYHIPAADALARLRGYAFAGGCMVEEVAEDLVARRLRPADIDT